VSPRVSVVVPTYNEAENVPVLVPRILEAMPDAEVVVVDDASPDGTAARSRELARRYPVKVVERRGERGLATAVLRGLDEAGSDICVVMDADLSHPPEAIPALVKAVEAGAEVAVGSRYVQGGRIEEWALRRRLTSRAGTLLARPLTAVCDPLAGFFCLRRSLLRGVELRPRGLKILLEILARAGADRVVEVPIRFTGREAGASKFSMKEQREYLAQLWSLYRALNAWPLKLAKFLVTGSTGLVVNLCALVTMVEVFGWNARAGAAVAAWLVAMTSNYTLNRLWTFRAGALPVFRSYVRYGLGVLAGLGVQLGVMHALSKAPYLPAAALGIVAGTLFNYTASVLWAFASQRSARSDVGDAS
jgi:dolichol-phosphate mannosyltransferase